MGKLLQEVIDNCKIRACILENEKQTTVVVDIVKRPFQKDLLGKKIGDTFKLPNVDLTYRIVAIEDNSDETIDNNPGEKGPSIPPTSQGTSYPVRNRVFWVFQNQTFEDEYRDEFIFAPYHGPHHWERLKEVKQGDIIIHSYHAEVVAVSVAKGSAYSWTRPDGAYGRRIDCEYHILKSSLNTSARNNENKRLCAGATYQPFNLNGTGNQGYLYEMTAKLRDYYIQEIKKYNPYIDSKIPELKKY